MEKGPKIAFAGTPDFAVPALRALLDAGYGVPLVMTQPDRGAGRGRQVAMSPVKAFAIARGVVVHQPQRLAGDAAPDRDWGVVPDVLVVAAYGLLLPQRWLDWPRIAAINIHASLLPRWRGAAPIQHALLAGDAQTGISIMRMTRGLDEGPVYAREATGIGAQDTAAMLHDRLAELGARVLIATLPGILDGSLTAVAQDGAAATYAPKIAKGDAELDWHSSAVELARRVRAFDPWPVAFGKLEDGRVLRIWRAHALDVSAAQPPGTILAAGPDGVDVATGRGVLRIERLQAPGTKPMSAQAYLNAHRLHGQCFVIGSTDGG
jgi:methionyl-tRNA formyltransferase